MKTALVCILFIILSTGLNCNFSDPCGDDSSPAKPYYSIINIYTFLQSVIDTLPSGGLKVETLSALYETPFYKLIINLQSKVAFMLQTSKKIL